MWLPIFRVCISLSITTLLLLVPAECKSRDWSGERQECVTDWDCNLPEEICHDDYCQCRSGVMYFRDTYKCLLPVGEECDVDLSLCSQHSECRLTNGKDRQCVCRDTYFKGVSGLCVHGYNQSCATNRDCDDEFVCTSKRASGRRCVCPQSEYDESSKSCQIPFGEACDLQSGPSCMPTMVCVKGEVGRGRLPHCQCPKGSVLNNDSGRPICSLYFRSRCDADGDLKCNPEQGLICRKGVCQCAKQQRFSSDLRICQTLEDGPCTPSQEDNKYAPCAPDLTCTLLAGRRKLWTCQKVPFQPISPVLWVLGFILVVLVGMLVAVVGVLCVVPLLNT